jgi:DNA polymerase I
MERRQQTLFETRKEEELPNVEWELPNLSDNAYALDTETTGLQIWGKDIPVGLSIASMDGSFSCYIPWGHQGFNWELEKVQQWAKDNLRDKHLYFANAKFDINMLRKVGINLESNNNSPHDVTHPAALLYSRRADYDLNSLAMQELGKQKVELEGDLKVFPMQDRNSAAVSWYARYDAMLTAELANAFQKKIDAKELGGILDLEDSIIYAVAHMEREGVYINQDLLAQWASQARKRYISSVLELYKLTGMRVEPTKTAHLVKLFHLYKLDYGFTENGAPSVTNDLLKSYLSIPAVQIAYNARQLAGLESRFLTKLMNAVGSDGKVRYALNQLKATNELDDKNVGTVTGRFSSSGGGKAYNGINIQQVFDDEKQGKIPCIADFPIRDLFIPAEGTKWLSADAKQIEFRFFAHYTEAMLKTKRLTNMYREDPLVDFHTYVAENIMHRPRKLTKNLNFGKIYGLGVEKLSNIYLKVPVSEGKEISAHYNREFPEASQLLQAAADIARSRDSGFPGNRGWVKTMFGRIRTFTDDDIKYNKATGSRDIPYYAALNAVIQGTAADVMKMKIKALYETREETGFNMRFTVHDEVDGDIPIDLKAAQRVQEILDTPVSDKLHSPILWEVAVGETWAKVEVI